MPMNHLDPTSGGYILTEESWRKLCASASVLRVTVWRTGGRMFTRRPGGDVQEFRCDTLHHAGFIRCQRPSLGQPCMADASYRLIGRQLACECGTRSIPLPGVVLDHLRNGAPL